MRTYLIRLNNISKAKEFANITYNVEFEIDLVEGRYTVDGKSILGIFSLDLSKDIEMRIYTKDEEKIQEFIDKIKTMIID